MNTISDGRQIHPAGAAKEARSEMSPRVLIIQPSSYPSRTSTALLKVRKRSLIGLTLPYLAALVRSDWDVTLVDELLTDVDFSAPADVVAITAWTSNSFRAYEIADRFRARGTLVIMGGPHTYFHAEEAASHCDAVGIGEGERILPAMLADAAAGRLQKIYRAEQLEALAGLPLPRYDLLDLGRYGFTRTYAVQASRGCPFECEFCSERFYFGERYRYRPVPDVIEEIKACKGKNIFFADSNFAGKKAHAMELMEALIPLRLRWSTLWSAYLCGDQKFLDLAKRSGLLHVNIGIESLDQATLAGMNKRANKAAMYREVLANLRTRGISYSLNFVFGWDTENLEMFDTTLAFLQEERVPVAYFNILSPHKGTPLYDRMKGDDRILDVEHIGRWPGSKCHIKPAYCTAQELEGRVRTIHRQFYSVPSMIRRLPLPVTQANIASWIMNLSELKVSRMGYSTENFDTF